MFCEECGKQIPDDSKFCDGCGASVKEHNYGAYTNPGGNRQPQNQNIPVYKPYGGAGYQQRQEQPVYNPYNGTGGPQPYQQPEYNRKKKEKGGSATTVIIIILAIVAVALIGVLVFLGIRTFGGKKDNKDSVILDMESSEDIPETTEEETTEAETTAETEPVTAARPEETSVPATETAPVQETTAAGSETKTDYILPNSNTAYLTEADIAGLSKEELRIARNEIYARHGRKFKDDSLNQYFMSKSWYVPLIEPDNFSEKVFNDYEIANRQLIANYEKKMGY